MTLMKTCDQHIKTFPQVVVKLISFSAFTKTTVSRDVNELDTVKHTEISHYFLV